MKLCLIFCSFKYYKLYKHIYLFSHCILIFLALPARKITMFSKVSLQMLVADLANFIIKWNTTGVAFEFIFFSTLGSVIIFSEIFVHLNCCFFQKHPWWPKNHWSKERSDQKDSGSENSAKFGVCLNGGIVLTFNTFFLFSFQVYHTMPIFTSFTKNVITFILYKVIATFL